MHHRIANFWFDIQVFNKNVLTIKSYGLWLRQSIFWGSHVTLIALSFYITLGSKEVISWTRYIINWTWIKQTLGATSKGSADGAHPLYIFKKTNKILLRMKIRLQAFEKKILISNAWSCCSALSVKSKNMFSNLNC